MSLYCSNPQVLSGERGDPPEIASDDERECSDCGSYIDMDQEPHLTLDNGDLLCGDCREICAYCGDWIKDYSQAVRMRDKATGLKEPWHRDCAVEHWKA